MNKTIAPHLTSTYKFLQCAFPQGISDRQYLALLVQSPN